MLASSRGPCGTGRSPGGINPAPTNLPKCPAKPDGRKTTRASVGRDALIPPDPAAAQTPRADMESAPTDDGEYRGQPGNRDPAASQTSVGDDACIVPGTPRWRKVSREGHGPPLQTTENDRPNRTAATTRASVGRDAPIPPDPTAAQIPTGGYGIHPYGRRRMPRPTGKPRPRVTTNPCRGRCLHCARRRDSEANRAAGPALRPEIVPGTPRWRKVSREGHGPPLQTTENDRPNRTAATTRASVGRDALIPPNPTAAQIPAGGYGIHPYGQW